jgi:phosphopantothenoylcysteine synthetase/decarboxylase
MANILIGITGGIAAYKIADLTSALVKNSHTVQIIMTENAKRFITPLTMATLSKRPVMDDAAEWIPDGQIKHIELSKWSDMFVIAPATATTLAKMAYGIADNLLTATYLASSKSGKKVLIFPAMNTNMWESAQNHANINLIAKRPLNHIVQPAEGMLACGDVGKGKLPTIDSMIHEIEGYFPNTYTNIYPKEGY